MNGQRREIAEGLTIADYLQSLGVSSQRVAVERNRRIVPRAEHANERLMEGDEVEIVTFVGGG